MVPSFHINPRFCLIFPYLLQVKNDCFDCKKQHGKQMQGMLGCSKYKVTQ